MDAATVVLVEGISDRIAVEAAALRLGIDLAAAGVMVVSAGGVGGMAALARQYGPMGAGLLLRGLCDAAEVPWLCKTVVRARVGIALDRAGLEALGFHICDCDLEDELIRAVGLPEVMRLIEAEGDMAAFTSFQRQKRWRGAALVDQIRRFMGAGAGRKTRYATLFVAAVDLGRMPAPLVAVTAGLRAGPLVV